LQPQVEAIQFVDGDCEFAPDWLQSAARFLQEHDTAAAVCGRRRETNPNRNIYHRWTDLEWDTPVGETKYCGGDALIRVSALERVGGYRDSLIAGEEPELCVRLRGAGWQVWRIDHEMVRHDVNLTSFATWWKRAVRSGHAYAEGARLHGRPPERHWVRETRSIWFWGALVPLLGFGLAWPTSGFSLAAMCAAYLALWAKVVRFRLRRGDALPRAAQYAAMCVVAKWPQALGQVLFTCRSWLGRQSRIIEYQQPWSTSKSS